MLEEIPRNRDRVSGPLDTTLQDAVQHVSQALPTPAALGRTHPHTRKTRVQVHVRRMEDSNHVLSPFPLHVAIDCRKYSVLLAAIFSDALRGSEFSALSLRSWRLCVEILLVFLAHFPRCVVSRQTSPPKVPYHSEYANEMHAVWEQKVYIGKAGFARSKYERFGLFLFSSPAPGNRQNEQYIKFPAEIRATARLRR